MNEMDEVTQLPEADEALPMDEGTFLTAVPGQQPQATQRFEPDLVQVEGLLEDYERVQSVRRHELATYLEELRHRVDSSGSQLVVFPEKYDKMVSAMTGDEKEDVSLNEQELFWESFGVEDIVPIRKTENGDMDVADKLRTGMEEIRRLDLLLAKKTKEGKRTVREFAASCKEVELEKSRTQTSTQESSEQIVEKTEECNATVQFSSVSLPPQDVKRLQNVLKQAGEDGGYHPAAEEIGRLNVIDARLVALTDDPEEWESKTEGTWRPDTAGLPMTPPGTARSLLSRASTLAQQGNEYLDVMKEERYMRHRVQEINRQLRHLHEEREISQQEVQKMINRLVAQQGLEYAPTRQDLEST